MVPRNAPWHRPVQDLAPVDEPPAMTPGTARNAGCKTFDGTVELRPPRG